MIDLLRLLNHLILRLLYLVWPGFGAGGASIAPSNGTVVGYIMNSPILTLFILLIFISYIIRIFWRLIKII